MDKDQKKIMLLLTEACNLNCVYCYEHFKNPKKMSFATAKEILDVFYATTAPGDTALIEVFGGEPFANFELMKQIDEYVMTVYSDRKTLFESTTNGTLVHGEIQTWLAQRRERYMVSLSLDGTREMHNKNRPFLSGEGSYDSIDFNFFLNTWPDCQAKLTMSEYTLPNLAEGIIAIHEQGFVCDATLSTGVDWNHKKNEALFARELEKLVSYYVANPEKELCTMLNFDLRLVFAKLDKTLRLCGAGEMTRCYDVAGNMYPCQGFAPVALGEGAVQFKDYDVTKFDLTKDNPCANCKFFFICANCYSANLATTGCCHLVDRNLCMSYRLCILASAKIQFERLKLKQQLDEDDKLILKAVSVIQNEITENDCPIPEVKDHVCHPDRRCCKDT